MARIVILSNRLPVTINRDGKDLTYNQSAGGLATGLNSLGDQVDKIWIGWPGEVIEDEWERESVKNDLQKQQLVPVFLNPDEIENYYEGFSNETIWPLFHYFNQYTRYRDRYWDAYQTVNQKFAEAAFECIEKTIAN